MKITRNNNRRVTENHEESVSMFSKMLGAMLSIPNDKADNMPRVVYAIKTKARAM